MTTRGFQGKMTHGHIDNVLIHVDPGYGKPAFWTSKSQGVSRLDRSSIPIGSMYGIYANIWGILMVNVTIYSMHGSYGVLIRVKSH